MDYSNKLPTHDVMSARFSGVSAAQPLELSCGPRDGDPLAQDIVTRDRVGRAAGSPSTAAGCWATLPFM